MSAVIIIAVSVCLPVGFALLLAIALGAAAADDDASRQTRQAPRVTRSRGSVATTRAKRPAKVGLQEAGVLQAHATRARPNGPRKAASYAGCASAQATISLDPSIAEPSSSTSVGTIRFPVSPSTS